MQNESLLSQVLKPSTIERTETQIKEVCREIEELLISKNRSYGDSALNPTRIFSKCDAVEQIKVRIDDKLSRLKSGNAFGEDVILDLLGYLILLRIAIRRQVVAEHRPESDTVLVPDEQIIGLGHNED